MPEQYNNQQTTNAKTPKNNSSVNEEPEDESSIEEGMFVVEALKNKRIRRVKKKPVEE